MVAALIGVSGCGDQTLPAPTQPPSFVVATAPACDPQLATLIGSEIKGFFDGAVEREALRLFSVVKGECSKDVAAAAASTIRYLDYFLRNYASGGAGPAPADKQQFAANHVDRNFVFVGLPQPDLAPAAFGPLGVVKACYVVPGATSDTCDVVTGDRHAGLRVNSVAALAKPAIFSLAPIAPSGCFTENLAFVPPLCYQANVNPKQTFTAPWLTAAICPAEGLGDGTYARARVAHPSPSAPTTAVKIGVDTEDPFGLACGDVTVVDAAAARTTGPGLLRGVGRAFAWALSPLAPRRAYAAHGGAGSLLSELSPIFLVDGLTFDGRFSNAQPGDTVPDAAERGTWTKVVQSPGSITVRAALGDLTTQPVELAQGGGACTTSCGTLELRGLLARGPASTGVYEVSWRSVQVKPTVKDAPFFLRSGGTSPEVLARLSYVTDKGSNTLRFASTAGGPSDVVGSWVQNVAQSFCLVVDLNASPRTVKLYINARATGICAGVDAQTPASVKTFTPTSLGEVSAIFRGIDAGIMGWDDVTVLRRDDPLPH